MFYIRKVMNESISLEGEILAHKTSLTPPLFIEVPVQRQESEH